MNPVVQQLELPEFVRFEGRSVGRPMQRTGHQQQGAMIRILSLQLQQRGFEIPPGQQLILHAMGTALHVKAGARG